MQKILGEEFKGFLDALNESPRTAIRPHPIKWSWTQRSLEEHFSVEGRVPWFPDAVVLKEKPEFWRDPLFFGGAYYVQEPSGLIVSHVFKRFGKPDGLVADVCGAPGGKSIQLLSLLNDTGFLVSAEPVPARYPALEENIIRWGKVNQALMRADSRAFATLPNQFDFVLSDVPCSGEGMFRKEPKSVRFWKPNTGKKLQAIQRQIITNALISTKVGGYFLYTTCTFNPEENELNAQWVIDTFGSAVRSIPLPELTQWNIVEGLDEWDGIKISAHTYRFYPHRVKGEGFFLALFQKTDVINPEKQVNAYRGFDFKPLDCQMPYQLPFEHRVIESQNKQFIVPEWFDKIEAMVRKLPIKYIGQEVACETNKPAHATALLTNPPLTERIPLSYDDAMKYLKGNVPREISDKYALVEYLGVPLGWLYKSGTPPRTKNPIPQTFRLKRSLPL
ncbi:MAG: hypothetical protein GXO48_00860 [Chlorobi bacterium]|nr:hypothetical protein [Chlorobiota bacterium]